MKKKIILVFTVVSMLFGSTAWGTPQTKNDMEDFIIKPMYIPTEAYIETNKSLYEDSEIIEVTVHCGGGIRTDNDPMIYDCILVDSVGNRWNFESEGKTSISLGYYPVGNYSLTVRVTSSLGYSATDSTTFEVK